LAKIETDQKSGVVSVNHQAGKNHFVISIPSYCSEVPNPSEPTAPQTH
jgi:hypothetical protein